MSSIFGDLRESAKGYSQDQANLQVVSSPALQQNSFAQSLAIEPAINVKLKAMEAPENIDFRNRKSTYYVDQYARASYYFYHCSILSTIILRMTQEALRKGIDWKPRFQSKCPKCGHEYHRSTKKCRVCGFEGEMVEPDESQKDLLVNWEGSSLLKKANKNGWSLLRLAQSFLIISLTYNQPLILCKSTYAIDEHGTVLDEFPQEFVPISPTKCRMIYDDTGNPGDGTFFPIRDRFVGVDMNNPEVVKEIMETGYYKNERLYPALYCVSSTDGGIEGTGQYFGEPEIYHDTYLLPSVTYGTPLCLLEETNIRTWMAIELRNEKYFSTGHPPGVFVVNNITEDSTAKLQQSIRIQMREDPYTIPVLGVPPASDKATSTKWHPFGVDPTESNVAIKQELLQRISSAFGMTGLILGDTEAMRGNGNEGHQIAIIDRNLANLREFVDGLLDWIVRKYKGITDWDLVVVDPPDNQAIDEAEKFNKQLLNAKIAKDLGFEIISQSDGKIEISATPKNYDPLASLFGSGSPDGFAENQGGMQDGFDNGLRGSYNDSSNQIFKQSLSKSTGGGDLLKDTTSNKGEGEE